MFNVIMGAHNYVVPPDQLNRRYNKPEDSGKIFEVDISGNICTYAAYVYSNQEYSGSFMHDASHLNLHLRGTWSMRDTRLWGNLGFDLETSNEITLNNLMKRPDDESPVYLLADGYPEKVPEVIFNDVEPDYSLWQLVTYLGTERDAVEKVYCNTLKAAQQVLKSGCTINQFCAFKDAHYHPSCRCALYYPLLLELNPLALIYFLDAGVHTKQYVSELYTSLPRAQVMDALNSAIAKRPVRLTRTEYGVNIFEAPAEAKAVRKQLHGVSRFCLAPNVHPAKTCVCGLFLPHLFLGSDLAMAYFIKSNPALADTARGTIFESISVGQIRDTLLAQLSESVSDMETAFTHRHPDNEKALRFMEWKLQEEYGLGGFGELLRTE